MRLENNTRRKRGAETTPKPKLILTRRVDELHIRGLIDPPDELIAVRFRDVLQSLVMVLVAAVVVGAHGTFGHEKHAATLLPTGLAG